MQVGRGRCKAVSMSGHGHGHRSAGDGSCPSQCRSGDVKVIRGRGRAVPMSGHRYAGRPGMMKCHPTVRTSISRSAWDGACPSQCRSGDVKVIRGRGRAVPMSGHRYAGRPGMMKGHPTVRPSICRTAGDGACPSQCWSGDVKVIRGRGRAVPMSGHRYAGRSEDDEGPSQGSDIDM